MRFDDISPWFSHLHWYYFHILLIFSTYIVLAIIDVTDAERMRSACRLRRRPAQISSPSFHYTSLVLSADLEATFYVPTFVRRALLHAISMFSEALFHIRHSAAAFTTPIMRFRVGHWISDENIIWCFISRLYRKMPSLPAILYRKAMHKKQSQAFFFSIPRATFSNLSLMTSAATPQEI